MRTWTRNHPMSGKGNEQKSKTVSKKKQKDKRQASSPLDDNSQLKSYFDIRNPILTSEHISKFDIQNPILTFEL